MASGFVYLFVDLMMIYEKWDEGFRKLLSEPPAVAGGLRRSLGPHESVKIRQIISLAVKDVIDGSFNASLVPQISATTLVDPRATNFKPISRVSHDPSRICLEGVQSDA